ncbi:MAG: hypothetical protein IPL89_03735 [Acidobacteria bacterium]|nr:hypothetical protein [Acidobacteriota bacterium]
MHARPPVLRVPAVVLPCLRDGVPVDPVVVPEPRVLGGDDGLDEGGGDLRERDGPPVDRVALARRAQALLARADESGRRRVPPAEKNYLRKRDEDEEEEKDEEKREIS